MSESDRDEEEEPRKEPAKDYYAGYYFGGNPYTSDEDLPGRKNDELRDDVIRRIKRYYDQTCWRLMYMSSIRLLR